MVALANVCEINPSPRQRPSLDDDVAFLPMSSVETDGTTSPGERRRFSEVASGYTLFERGDVLVAKITPCFENGKIAQAIPWSAIAAGSTEFHVVRPIPNRAHPRYVFHYLRQPCVRDFGQRRMTGSAGQRRVPESFLKELDIPLPPFEEQRRLAAILDKAEDLRRQRRTSSSLCELLPESIFVEMFGDLSAGQWTDVLGTAANFVGGGTPPRAVQTYFEGAICWATSKDMKSTFLTDTEEHITDDAIINSATKLVPAGSVLVVVKSKVLAHSLPVAETRVPTCFGQDLKGILPKDGWRSSFLASALRVGSRWLLERARGVNTEGLTLEHLRKFPIPAVQLDDQDEFVQRVEQSVQLQACLSKSSEEIGTLFASLQHRAFAGEL